MPNLKQLFQVGEVAFHASSLAEATQIAKQLQKEGKVAATAQLTTHAPQEFGAVKVVEGPAATNFGKVRVVPAVAAVGSPLEALRDLGKSWQSGVVDPIAGKLKETLTPDISVQGQTIPTSSSVSNKILETAADPINYVPGPTGAVLGAAETVAGYAHGGVVQAAQQVEQAAPVQQVELYDMSGSTPVLGSVPADQVHAAVESGQFAFPVNKSVSVFNPDGELGEVPGDQAAEALKQGFKFATPEEVKYSNRPLAAGALGTAQSLTAGLAGAGLGKLGEMLPGGGIPTRQELNKLEEHNPGAYTAGQVAGVAGSLLTGTGIARGALAAGEAAASGIGTATLAGRVGSAATKAAIENMVFAGSDELAKTFMAKPDQSVETALSNLGLAAAIGGGIGGAFKAVPELWSMGPGKKLGEMLNGVKLATEGKPTAELAKLNIAAAPEIQSALSDSPVAQRAFQELMQADTTAGRTAQESLERFTTSLDDAATRTLGRTADDVSNISLTKTGESVKESLNKNILDKYEPLAKSYEALESKFGSAALMPEARDSMTNQLQQLIVDQGLLKSKAAAPMLKVVTDLLEDLPKQANAQDLRQLVQNLRAANPFGKETYNIAKNAAKIANEGMDQTLLAAADTAGADAGALFRSTQSDYRAFKATLEDLNDYLHAGKVRGAESFVKSIRDMDPEDVARRLSREKSQLRATLEQNFPEVAEKIKQFSYDSLLDKARVGDSIDIRKLMKQIDNLEPETKHALFTDAQLENLKGIADLKARIPKNMNPSGTAKTLLSLAGQPASVIAGTLLGGGVGGISAMLGAYGLREGADATKLAMLRFLASDAPTNAAAFKQALGMASAVEKGERQINKAVSGVFESGSEKVKAPDTEKLKKLVDEYVADESKLLETGADLGHYLPDQAASLGQATVRNIRYLASLKPSTAPLSPLDATRKVSDSEQAKYDRALAIAEQPLLVLAGVQQGRVTTDDIQHLAQMYPALGEILRDKLQMQMIDHKGKGKNIKYATQMGLSAFLAQPLVSSLQPRSIMASQSHHQRQPATTQNQRTRQTPGMSKLAPAYMTPAQSAAGRRIRH